MLVTSTVSGLQRLPPSRLRVWVLGIDIPVALLRKDGRPQFQIKVPVPRCFYRVAPGRRLTVAGVALNIRNGQSGCLIAELDPGQEISDDPGTRRVVVEVYEP